LLQNKIKNYNREDLLQILHQKGVPSGSIRNMKEVFELPVAANMVLKEKMKNGQESKRVKTVAFQWTPNKQK
jgi:crotonobetainyl-CoA:carnitine CoA-transferase CaiB-like acyl-CoA transferase